MPNQSVGPVHVRYAPQGDWILEIHSHPDGLARFSSIDDLDERGFRLYGVVGRLNDSRPHVALRAGVYGYFLSVPWTSVFAGDPYLVNDVHYESPGGDHPDVPCGGKGTPACGT
jgi:hypothetical protein